MKPNLPRIYCDMD